MMRSDVTHEWKEYLLSIDERPPTDDHPDDIAKSWSRKKFLGTSGRSPHLVHYRMALDGKASEIKIDSPQLQEFVNNVSDFQPLSEDEIREFTEEILTPTAIKLLRKNSKRMRRIYRGLEDLVYLDNSLKSLESTLVVAVQELKDTLDDKRTLIAEHKKWSKDKRDAELDKLNRICSEEANHEALEICRMKRSTLREEAAAEVTEILLRFAESRSSRVAANVSKHVQDILHHLDPGSDWELPDEVRASLRQNVLHRITTPNSGYPDVSAIPNITVYNTVENYAPGSMRDYNVASEGSNINTGTGDQYSEGESNTE